jgi:hypothetical protein
MDEVVEAISWIAEAEKDAKDFLIIKKVRK